MEPQNTDATQATGPSNASKKIVIIEDNTSLAEIYKTRLEILGYTCFVAYNGITGLYFVQKEIPNLVLLDLMVPDIAGDQILLRMRSSAWGKHIPVYIISNLNEADAPAGLRELGISGYSVKANLSDDQLDQIVDNILKPADQTEDISLENPSESVSTPIALQEPPEEQQSSFPVTEPPAEQ